MSRYATYNKGGVSRPLMRIPDLDIILQPKISTKDMTLEERREHAKKIEPAVLKMREEGLSWDKIAARTGLSAQRLRLQFPDKKAGNWLKSEKIKGLHSEIIERLNKGRTQKSIAEELNINRSTLSNHIKAIKHELRA